jgi:putative heme iron utilization protein
MKDAAAARLAELLRARSVAALGTLRAGAPYVSMVPYARAPDGSGLLIHVSALASHTRDMRADARVCVLVMQQEGGGSSALALARASIEGRAEEFAADAPELPALRSAYLARFPDAAQMFGFADFALFRIRPESGRFVGGFGDAHSFSGATLMRLLAG